MGGRSRCRVCWGGPSHRFPRAAPSEPPPRFVGGAVAGAWSEMTVQPPSPSHGHPREAQRTADDTEAVGPVRGTVTGGRWTRSLHAEWTLANACRDPRLAGPSPFGRLRLWVGCARCHGDSDLRVQVPGKLRPARTGWAQAAAAQTATVGLSRAHRSTGLSLAVH